MKSREVMQRIERAGWHAVRQTGGHITFERKGKRVVYGIGRPQDDVGKNRLREIVRDFALERIEREAAEQRAAESAAEATALAERAAARVTQRAAAAAAERERAMPHLNGELTYSEMHVLFAQLHKEHGYDMSRLAKAVGIPFKRLSEYIHGQQPSLQPFQLELLRKFFTAQEVKLSLTRDRQVLLDRGWGVRTGMMNAPDPRLVEIAEALKATGKKYSVLDRQIFGGRSLVGPIARGDVKRVFPRNMAILEAWYAKQQPRIRTEIVEPMHPPTKSVVEQPPGLDELASFEDELRAVEAVLRAVSKLPHKVARRVLGYAVQRLEEG